VVIVGGFYFTLLTTAGSVIGVRKLFATTKELETTTVVAPTPTSTTQPVVVVAAQAQARASKPFSQALLYQLSGFTVLTGMAALVATRTTTYASVVATPLTALFLLGATLQNFVFGARLPSKFVKVVHPLVTCTSLTWMVATVWATLTGSTFRSVLRSYKTGRLGWMTGGGGAGDVLLFLLGPAVLSLAVSMYGRRKLMKDNLKELIAAIGVSSLGGLVGTATAVRLLQIGNPYIRLSLLSRNITSPLAMAIASILGADVSLAVSMVVVTGLLGANFGASIMDAFGIQDAVARGMGMGAAAHGLGTAAIVNEKDAFPFSAISMSLTASACTVLVSIPLIKRLVLQLALG
jgi:putative effector of murein hydrolase